MLKVNQQFMMKTKIDKSPRLFQYLGKSGDDNPCFEHVVKEVATGELSEVETDWFDEKKTGRQITPL